MQQTISEAMEYIEENDVKFIRLAFCDLAGVQKNVSIMPSELPRAFAEGIGFDAAAFPCFARAGADELMLRPDPSTLAILPWRPSQGRVVRFYCDIHHPDGTPFAGDGRQVLRQAVREALDLELSCTFGTECEFYLFELDENGQPTRIPHDQAGYCDIAPLDRAEDVRREICLTLEEMGLCPERSHHEQGPGQNEVDFRYASALTAADNLITFRSVVRTVAAAHGLYASFLPKPLPDAPGSGLHINLSLRRGGRNLFQTGGDVHCAEAEQFLAGILHRTREITAFLNPTAGSYRRFGAFEAPRYLTWSHRSRSQLIRIPAASGDLQRMELRSPDPCANPYLAFALLIRAGLEGVREGLTLPAPCSFDPLTALPAQTADLTPLPATLGEALSLARRSPFVAAALPEPVRQSYLAGRQAEWDAFCAADDPAAAEQALCFGHC